MKYVIASDLHGSALYTKTLLESVEREAADRLLLLGDLLYHGPRNDLPAGYDPKETAGLLNKKKNMIFAVRGNCEAEVDQQVLEFPVMADYAVFVEGAVKVFATHRHLYNENHIPPLTEDFIFLHGHTHIPRCERHGGLLYMNPGSVSIPKGGSERSYILWNEDEFTLKTLEGTILAQYMKK